MPVLLLCLLIYSGLHVWFWASIMLFWLLCAFKPINVMPPHLLFFLDIVLTIWDINSSVCILGLFSYFYKGISFGLIGSTFNLYATLGNMINLTILNLSINEHELSFSIPLSCVTSFFFPVSYILVPIFHFVA